METSLNNKIKVGIFIAAGFMLFIVAIFVIGGKSNLFTPTFKVKAEFETVAGLKNGSQVRFNGINIGTVTDISIQSPEKALVIMSIEKNVQQFIKKDSKAVVSSEGLVGNKIVEIMPGSSEAPHVQNEDIITTISPIEVEDILKNLDSTSSEAGRLIGELTNFVVKVNSGQGTLGQLATNDALYRNADETVTSFKTYSQKFNVAVERIMQSVNLLTDDAQIFTSNINAISGNIQDMTEQTKLGKTTAGKIFADTLFANNLNEMIVNANQLTKNLEKGSFSFQQNMEALKHNFFFKGYFEDMGYWDKDKTEQVIEDKKRQLEDIEQKLRIKKKELEDLDKQSEK
ncbi:MAG TPA: MlaD family protein [Ignavibacteria bacterium]|jgi:phospholipid/cholesterol/gamma-HCH transport system substrate-binding protein